MNERIENHLRYTLGLVNEWLRFADAKNAVLLAVATGAIYAAASLLAESKLGAWFDCYLILAILQSGLASVSALLAFIPRVRLGQLFATTSQKEEDSIYHYGDIAKYAPAAYVGRLCDEFGETTSEVGKSCNDLAGQVVVNSRITMRKYQCFTIGAWLMLSAAITPIGAAILWARGEGE